MRVLITGGAGFIGSHLADALLAAGHTVSILDNLSSGSIGNLPKGVTLYERSVTEDLNPVFAKAQPEVVFHLAAQIDVRKSVENPRWDAEQNILGSINLLDTCLAHGCKRVIFSSTGGALYGFAKTIPTPEDAPVEPESPYGIAKRSVEHYLHFYRVTRGVSTCVLRYGNVYGPRQALKGEAGVVAIFAKKLLKGEHCTINGDGSQTRDYVYVADVVAANMAALTHRLEGAYNVGTGVETSVNDIYRKVAKHLGNPWAAKHGAAIAGELPRSALSTKKFAQYWKPHVGIDEGLTKTVTWFQQHEVETAAAAAHDAEVAAAASAKKHPSKLGKH